MFFTLKSCAKALALLEVLTSCVVPSDALFREKLSVVVPSDAKFGSEPLPVSLAVKSAVNATGRQKDAVNATGHLRQPAGTVTETSYENWFQRLGDAFASLILGIVLIFCSIPCMWVNERRAARYECLIIVGEDECMSISVDKVNVENRGCLVHASGLDAEGCAELKDDRFPSFKFDSKCLRISTSVEAYQWVQHEQQEKRKDSVGGGETTVTTYSYSKEWTCTKIDSSKFKQKGHDNHLAKMIGLGLRTKNCSVVHYGDAFELKKDMVSQLTDFKDASSTLGDSVDGFTKNGVYYYYPEKRSEQSKIGDLRASFRYIPDGPATVVGLQAESHYAHPGERDTFLPYRLVSRGLCCWTVSDEQLKKLRIQAGEKTPDELYAEDKLSCGLLSLCLYCCIGVCNLVTYCFSGLAPPQIYHLYHGDRTATACWSDIKAEADMQKWIIRVIAWLAMLVGLMMVFQPVFTVIDIIPLLGTYLSDAIQFLVFIVAFIVTLSISTLVVSVAYLFYRPQIGLFYLLFSAACVIVPCIIIHALK